MTTEHEQQEAGATMSAGRALGAGELLPCPFCGGAGEVQHSYHEDDDRHPRDFWHVRAACSECDITPTGWCRYGNQEQRVANFHVKQKAEADAIAAWNTRPTPDSERAGGSELDSYEKFDGVGPHSETIETRARIGESYLEAYESALNDPLLAGYTPADCPSELLLDLLERLHTPDLSPKDVRHG